MANTIHAKGERILQENLANAIITPGMLIELMSTNKVKPHATEGGFAEVMIAQEDALQGNEQSDNYAAGALVQSCVYNAGDEAYLLIKSGESIAIGDDLISAGDGTLIENGSEASATTVKQIIATALAACDLSASGSSNTLCLCRIR